MSYATHEAARKVARESLRQAILDDILARIEAMRDPSATNIDAITGAVLGWEEEAFEHEIREPVYGAVNEAYPWSIESTR